MKIVSFTLAISCTFFGLLWGAGKVFVVDYIPERLKLAKSMDAIPIDFTTSDPVTQIEALRAQHSTVDTLLPGGSNFNIHMYEFI